MGEFKRKITNEEFLEALFDPEIEEEMILNSEKHVARDEGHAEGHAKGLAEGLAEGHVEGLKEASMAIAKSLLDSGMDIELVSKHTNLSLEQVKKIKES